MNDIQHDSRSTGQAGAGRGEPVETFTFLTTSATAAVTDVHHRQSPILRAEDFEEWLTSDSTRDRLLAPARRAYEGRYESLRVSHRANKARNDDPDLLLALEE